jgi:hypothetical protein
MQAHLWFDLWASTTSAHVTSTSLHTDCHRIRKQHRNRCWQLQHIVPTLNKTFDFDLIGLTISYVCVLYIVVCPFSFGHCVVCSSIYGFYLLLWYLQTLLTFTNAISAKDFWLEERLCRSFDCLYLYLFHLKFNY